MPAPANWPVARKTPPNNSRPTLRSGCEASHGANIAERKTRIETFLREAEEGGDATEAGFARRCLGASGSDQGKLLEAQTHLERALADYQPDRDAQHAVPFRPRHENPRNCKSRNYDLAPVSAPHPQSAKRSRVSLNPAHVPKCAFAHVFKTGLEILRNDPGAALRSAETLLALVREHGMEFFVAVGEAYAGWARGRLGDPQAGAQVIRRALAEEFNETDRNQRAVVSRAARRTRGRDAGS